jgi:hypothetical protein
VIELAYASSSFAGKLFAQNLANGQWFRADFEHAFQKLSPVALHAQELVMGFPFEGAPPLGVVRSPQLLEIIAAINDARIDKQGSFGGFCHPRES